MKGTARLVIDRFNGPYAFLSNFYPFTTRDGVETTAEHIYQSCKCADPNEAYHVLNAKTAGLAKKIGRHVKLVPDWDNNRVPVMLSILRDKFRYGVGMGGRLAGQLAETGDAELIEGNTWGDTFWGVYNGQGENWLGVLLMLVREELQEELREKGN